MDHEFRKSKRICYLYIDARDERMEDRCPLVFKKRKTEGLVGAQLSNYFPTWISTESRLPLPLRPRRRWRNIVPTARITTADGFKPRRSPLQIASKIAPRWILDGSWFLHEVFEAVVGTRRNFERYCEKIFLPTGKISRRLHELFSREVRDTHFV